MINLLLGQIQMSLNLDIIYLSKGMSHIQELYIFMSLMWECKVLELKLKLCDMRTKEGVYTDATSIY